MATQNYVNIGSDNGLLPDGTKPLPDPMLTIHQLGLVAFMFLWNAQDIYPWYEFENYLFEITAVSPRGQWVNQSG